MKNEQKIRQAYLQHLREEGKRPESLHRFLKPLKISEREFYKYFSSLEAIEATIWTELLENTIKSIESGREYKNFTAQQRLLTLGFAFLENALDYRSAMKIAFTKIGPFHLSCNLDSFASRFKTYAQTIVDHGKATEEIADRGKLLPLYKEGLYLVFKGLIDFYLNDTSKSFERSDAYWEKTVKLAFDLMRSQAIDSAVDLARFMIPHKA